jgi:uncharacterized protein
MGEHVSDRISPGGNLTLPCDEALLDAIRRRIIDRFPDASIVLFGSRASGTSRPDSDLDLLVVANTSVGLFTAAGEVYRVLEPRRVPIDVIFMTPELFAERRKGFDPFVSEIISKGRVLHGRLP